MIRLTSAMLFVGFWIAVLWTPSADAATYNFYFPKSGGAPQIERVDEVDERDEPVVVAEPEPVIEDVEEHVVEEVIPVPTKKRKRVVFRTPTTGQSTKVQLGSLALEISPGAEISAEFDADPDALSGTNTTSGLRLRPRTKVVRRTIVLDR